MKEIAPHIAVDQNIQGGKPVIAGTRVPVDLIVGKVAGGMSVADVAEAYELPEGKIQAALQYAAQLVREENRLYAE